MGYGCPFLGVKNSQGVMLTTHSHLEPRSRISRSISSHPWRLHGGSGTDLLFYFYFSYNYFENKFLKDIVTKLRKQHFLGFKYLPFLHLLFAPCPSYFSI
jgi:hypothetical protein